MNHVTALESMAAQLNDLGVSVTDHDIITKIVCSLPTRFDNLVSSWDGMQDQEKTLDALRARLVSEERKFTLRKAQASGSSIETATASPNAAFFGQGMSNHGRSRPDIKYGRGGGSFRGSQRQSSAQGRSKDQVARDNAFCSYCHKARHYAFECRKRIEDEGASQGNNKKANLADSSGGKESDRDFSFVSTECLRASEPATFYLDSGCTQHMSDQRSFFTNFRPIAKLERPIDGIGGAKLYARGIGDIAVSRRANGIKIDGWLRDVLYVPQLTVNLVSIGCITENGYMVVFSKDSAKIMQKDDTVMEGSRIGKTLYRLDISAKTPPITSLIASSSSATLNVWHERLSHVSHDIVKKMATSNHVIGMDVEPVKEDRNQYCNGCNLGKMHKLPFSTSTRTTTRVGELIHTDLVGPMHISSPNGAKYYIVFKDDYSRYKVAYFLKLKSESPDLFKLFSKKMYCETGKRVVTLRSDNGGEFMSHEFQSWLTVERIKHEMSAPHTPEQNGKAERDHRTTVEAARSQIHGKNLPLTLWAEAVNHSVYTLNRTLTKQRQVTPYEMWHGTKPDISHLRIFGSVAYALIADAERRKLEPKAIKGLYVGESEQQKASRIFIKETGKTIICRHVKIYETEIVDTTTSNKRDEEPGADMSKSENASTTSPPENFTQLTKDTTVSIPQPIRQSTRQRVPKKLWPMEAYAALMSSDETMTKHPMFIFYEPKSFKEAMTSTERDLWKKAADEEIRSHQENNTWTVMPLPPNRVSIPSGWNFKIKTDKDGQPKRRKARFFAKGYRQIKGIDFQESFAPVVRYDSLRVLMAIAAMQDLELVQLDVATAFLNGDIDEEIYITQPEGYIIPGRETEVCKLNKSLYGIRQASRIWNLKLNSVLIAAGLRQSNADPCVYFRTDNEETVIVAIWVDDGIIAGNRMATIDKIVNTLKTSFKMTHGPAEHFVGLVIQRDRANKQIVLSAPQYVEKILAKFQMNTCHPISTPTEKGTPRLSTLPPNPDDSEIKASFPYREAVGSIMYAAITIRPDISFIAGQLAQHCENPSPAHWKGAKRVLRYLAGTRDHGICFGGKRTNPTRLNGYSDADYAGDPNSRKSTSGFLFTLNGGPITWSSRRQPIVALSTMEAEYIAASDACREATWIRLILSELGAHQNNPTTIWCDNESAISLAKNPESHKRSKHIDVRYHHIREQIKKGVVNLSYVNTKNQLADILTKGLDRQSQEKLMKEIGIVKP